MAATVSTDSFEAILNKGLQASLDTTEIDTCSLRFTTDTKRLYIDASPNRIQICDAIFDYTESQIKALQSYLPKIYVASDNSKAFVSNGTLLKEIVFAPVSVSDNEAFYITLANSSGTKTNGYNSGFTFNPSSKALTAGNLNITQTVTVDGDDTTKTVDFYIL